MQVSNKQKLMYASLAALLVFALVAGFRAPSALVDSALVARAPLVISVEDWRIAIRYRHPWRAI
jgi:hypothetical protein